MKLELIFAGKYLGKPLFAKRANDGIFFSVPDDTLSSKLIESGVYELELEIDHAIPKLNNCADVEQLLVFGMLSSEPVFKRTVSGKPLHFDIQERKVKLHSWLDELNNAV